MSDPNFPHPVPPPAPIPMPGAAPIPMPGAAPIPMPGAAPIPMPGAAPIPMPGAAGKANLRSRSTTGEFAAPIPMPGAAGKANLRSRSTTGEFAAPVPLATPTPEQRVAEAAAASGTGSSSLVSGLTADFAGYQLIREIARGGMGMVWEARQRSTNRIVAVKMIKTSGVATRDDPAAVDERELIRFRSEAEIMANLDHPNIVPVYEVGEQVGRAFFAMKLLTGGSLRDRLNDLPATPHITARILAETARGVAHAHQRGILHRDLKPSNIMFDADGRPVVTDFGLAKKTGVREHVTQSDAVLGTPHYMSPEQARGQNDTLTTAADIWGLGAVLYVCLTGQPPFQGDSEVAIVWKLMAEEPTPPRKLNSRVDRDLEMICMKCLEKQPEQRYESAEALARDLERWAVGEPISFRPPGEMRKLATWIRQRPTTVFLILIGITIVGVEGLFLSHTLANRQQETAARELERELDGEVREEVTRLEAARTSIRLGNEEYEELRSKKIPTEQSQLQKLETEKPRLEQELARVRASLTP